jgi:spore maturation protein CgeB
VTDGRFKDKTILTVLMRWEYGDALRGPSTEGEWFHRNLEALAGRVVPFWYDGLLGDLPRLQAELLRTAREIRPDLLFFVPFTEQFAAATLDALKAEFATFAWFGDDHWRFDGYTGLQAPHYTFVSTTDPFAVRKYRAIGIEPILTQWAAQPLQDDRGPLPEGEPFAHEVTFVGLHDRYREWLVGRLAAEGIRVECFGSGWPAGRLAADEMMRTFRTSRINLNISNSANRDFRFVTASLKHFKHYRRAAKRMEQVKARNFEIPLAGGFQLSGYAPGLERCLDIGREVAVYVTPEECAEQIRYYLENEGERRAIAEAGHARAAREHTFPHRLSEILSRIWP